MPTKKVKFGNTAGIGPDVVYAVNEMLRNATRLREVHENWQALFPRGSSLLIIKNCTKFLTEGRGYVMIDKSKAGFEIYNPPFSIGVIGNVETFDGQGKGWILSVYPQVHCLVSSLSQFHVPKQD